MKDSTANPTTSMNKLRRLAPRAGSIIERHAPEHPELRPFQVTLLPLTRRYVGDYDRRGALEHREARVVTAGRDAVAHARARMQAWLPNLRREEPELDFEAKRVPEDLFAEIARVLLLVEARDEAALPYRDAVLDDVGTALDEARAAWAAAQRTLAEQQRERAELRGLANELVGELKVLRRTLRRTLGTKHRDYQKLRVARAHTPDPDDDEQLAAAVADSGETPEPTTQLVA